MKTLLLVTVMLLLSGAFLISPVHATSVPNIGEGNWTSYKEVYALTTGQPWGAGSSLTAGIDTSGTALLLFSTGTNSFSVSSAGEATTIVNGGGVTLDVLGQSFSTFGTYGVGFKSTAVLIFQSGKLLSTLTPDTGVNSLIGVSISSDGQWVVAFDSSNPSDIELWQGQGQGPTLPITSNVCVVGGGICNGVGSGQPGYTYGSNFTSPTSTSGGILQGNLTQAQQTVANNPLPYGLIALIIIVIIGLAVYLRYANENKGGFRQPSSGSSAFRRP